MQTAQSRLDGGEVYVGPVCGGEVGWDAWVCGTEQVKEKEEADLREGSAVLVEF